MCFNIKDYLTYSKILKQTMEKQTGNKLQLPFPTCRLPFSSKYHRTATQSQKQGPALGPRLSTPARVLLQLYSFPWSEKSVWPKRHAHPKPTPSLFYTISGFQEP